MELSILLAKILGLTLMFVAVALLTNKKNIALLFSIYKHAAAVFLTGVLETVMGLSLVFIHNIWTFDFRGVITFIGWMLLARGIGRIFFPYQTTRWLEKFKKMKSVMTVLLVFVFLVGAYLAYMGFTS